MQPFVRSCQLIKKIKIIIWASKAEVLRFFATLLQHVLKDHLPLLNLKPTEALK